MEKVNIELNKYLKNLIIRTANEQNLTVDTLIEKSINFYIEKIINTPDNEVIELFFKLPKVIRKIITKSFFEDNLDYFESSKSVFNDEDFPVLTRMMSGENTNKMNINFSDDALHYFALFLKENDIFNSEI